MRRIKDIIHNGKPLADILSDHKKWLAGAGEQKADLSEVNLSEVNLSEVNLSEVNLSKVNLSNAYLSYSNLSYSNLSNANLSEANLSGADLHGVNLIGANLHGANLIGANLHGANLSGANLSGVSLCCFGNMKEIRTMQIETWAIGYTADTLQIGCQRHAIDKWRKWATPAGRKWIQSMDKKALEWADRNLALILQIIDANPATPTGHEKND